MADRDRAEAGQKRKLEQRERELLRTEKRVSRILSVADLMALLMVAATAFSAYATWRTAQVSALIFATADRPFIGVQKVTFERTDTDTPAVVVDFRNFGPISASGAILNVHALLDGHPVKPLDGEMPTTEEGIVSPSVPHFSYVFIHSEDYKKVIAGNARLMIHVRVEYQGPELGRRYCYFEKNSYDYHSGMFRAAGGSDRCGNTDIF